jgi:hypothetical protein
VTEINVLGLVEQVAEHDRDHRWRITRCHSQLCGVCVKQLPNPSVKGTSCARAQAAPYLER